MVEKREEDFSVLQELARDFLAIPATSSPSEKVWSVSARVMQAQKANIGEKLSSGIMFVKENVRLLRTYYPQLVENDKTALPLELTGIPDPDNDNGENDMDVGGDLFSENLCF